MFPVSQETQRDLHKMKVSGCTKLLNCVARNRERLVNTELS